MQGDVLVSLYFISRGSIEIVKDDVVLAILGKVPWLNFTGQGAEVLAKYVNTIAYIEIPAVKWIRISCNVDPDPDANQDSDSKKFI